jgi:hypothetical protein
MGFWHVLHFRRPFLGIAVLHWKMEEEMAVLHWINCVPCLVHNEYIKGPIKLTLRMFILLFITVGRNE